MEPWSFFQLLVVFTMGMMLLGIVASVPVYIQHIRKNPAVPQDERLPWILGTVFSITVTTNLYFMKYILPPSDAEDPKAAASETPMKMALWVFGPNLAYVLGIVMVMFLHSTPIRSSIPFFLAGLIFAAGMVVAMLRLVKLSIHARANTRLVGATQRYWLIGLWLLNGPVSLLYYFLQLRRAQ